VELLGGYLRFHYVIEGLRGVSGNLETRGHSRRGNPKPPATRHHKIEQRLPAGVLDQLVLDYQAGDKTPALAKRYDISTTAVKRLLHARGVPLRCYHRLTEQEIAQAADLYRAGWSLARLGRKLDADDETVRKRLKEVGVPMRSPGGYRNG
jgi:hypothetical protein